LLGYKFRCFRDSDGDSVAPAADGNGYKSVRQFKFLYNH
jgi:hypothetical protein